MADIISGKIIKGIGGFYYIDAEDGHLYECKAKGIFRNKKIKPLVGDNVNIEILDPENNLGNIVEILPRFNSLIRPAVANVDQTIIIFAVSEPEPNFNLLDRFLVSMEKSGVETIICFNKTDLSPDNMEACRSYSKSGYETIFISAREGEGIDRLREIIKDRTTVFAGPSGVGKSSTLNAIKPEAEDLKEYFPDIAAYTGKCRFNMCNHVSEPDCLVKQAVADGEISRIRYEDYVMIYNDLKEKRKW